MPVNKQDKLSEEVFGSLTSDEIYKLLCKWAELTGFQRRHIIHKLCPHKNAYVLQGCHLDMLFIEETARSHTLNVDEMHELLKILQEDNLEKYK